MAIRIKRAYDPAAPADGVRILVDRLWPRGLTKEKLQLTAWIKAIAPSNALRNSFHHDVPNWDVFRDGLLQGIGRQFSNCQVLARPRPLRHPHPGVRRSGYGPQQCCRAEGISGIQVALIVQII